MFDQAVIERRVFAASQGIDMTLPCPYNMPKSLKVLEVRNCRGELMQVAEPTQHEADAVKIFQALGDPTRFRIVHMLLEREELGCAEIQGISRLSTPGLSYHFRILQDCGLLVFRKEGRFRYFRLQRERLEHLLPILSSKHV